MILALLIGVGVSVTAASAGRQTLAPAEGPRHKLVADGQAVATIVLPEKPDSIETHAAAELQRYAKAITGVTIPIVSEPQKPQDFGLWLGQTAAARSAGFALSEEELGRDGYAAKADEKGLVVAGRCPLGTLFGVYDLVEREFGVRWCEPDELGEVVPKADTLSIGTFRREFKPSFRFRWVDSNDWSLKQRMNCYVKIDGKPVGVSWKWHFHTFAILIPPEKYSQDHPEWFAQVNGKRQTFTERPSHGAQPCTSNPVVVDKLIEGLLKTLDADPTIEIITLSPNDGGGFCECEDCTALDGPDRGWFARYSNRLAVLNNHVGKGVAERYPNVKIKVGAYAMYARLPSIKDYQPEPNLLFQLCHIYFCHNHPITSGKCQAEETYKPSHNFLPNQEFAEILRRWRRLTENLFIYEYYALGGWSRTEMLWPMVHTMRHDIPWYRDMGAKGFYTQIGPWKRAPLNYYIAAKLAWNADLDVDWLIDDFCHKLFEDAAEPMHGYLAEIEEAMVRNDQCISYGLREGRAKVLGPKIFDQPTRDRLRSLLDDAQQRAKSELVRRRIAEIRLGFEQCEKSILGVK
jgi:hypothetical protein